MSAARHEQSFRSQPVTLSLHGRAPTDFQILRSVRAIASIEGNQVKAYINDAAMCEGVCVGFSFAHVDRVKQGPYADGALVLTEQVVSVRKLGRFWVLFDGVDEYVIASFAKGHGRQTFRRWVSKTDVEHPNGRMFYS